MASRLAQLAEQLTTGILGKATKPEAVANPSPIVPANLAGQTISAEVFEKAVKAAMPGNAAALDVLLKMQPSGDLGPVSMAIFKGLAAAIPGLLLLPAMAQTTGEVPFMRPLRKAFSPAMLTGLEITEAWRRGAIDRETADEKLAETGLSKEDAASLYKITEFRAGAQDIIRFAVREVYTPAIREKFKLDEGVDEVIKTAGADLTVAGVSDETLRKYWAAHWELPSVGMGYEMLHRGIITEAELDLLMRALDINPFWREKLKALSFTPLTRVDVRRMHKLGVLDDAGVLKAYRDIGYSPENAQLMLDFTLAANGNPEASEETFADREAKTKRDLSKSDILNGFIDGIVTEAEALKGLTTLGYSAAEAKYLVQHEQLEKAKARAKEIVKSVRLGFTGGIFDSTAAQQELLKTGLQAAEVNALLASWKLEQQSRVVMPTRSDVLRWLKGKRITEPEAVELLERQGVPDKFIELYVDENLPEGKERPT